MYSVWALSWTKLSALAFNHYLPPQACSLKATFTLNWYLQCPMPLVQRRALLGEPRIVPEPKGRTPRRKARAHAVAPCPKMCPRPVRHSPRFCALFRAIPHEQGQVDEHLPTVRQYSYCAIPKGTNIFLVLSLPLVRLSNRKVESTLIW